VSDRPPESEQRVTPLELFFDLVFVFAITQVTGYLADHSTWIGLLQGLLILMALWWAWASYAWLTNWLNPEEGAVRIAMFGSMAAMLIVSLAVPNAFGVDGVVFGVAYFIVRVMDLVLYAISGRGDRELFKAILRITPGAVVGPALLIVAGFTEGTTQIAIWVIALAIDYTWVLIGGGRGWRVSPEHFVERHGLIVIIAIGESLIAIGLGEKVSGLRTEVIVAAVLGFAVAASFWLAYFDFFTIRAHQMLTDRSGAARAALARDVYTYLHFPMVAGIILFAFAMKTTLADVDDELATIPALGLCCGPALYLFAFVAIRMRASRTFRGGRLIAAVAFALLWPVAVVVPAFAALTLVAIVWVGLHAYEIIWWREARADTRALRGPAS